MAMESPVFLEVIIAWSVSHLALVVDKFEGFAIQSRCKALRSLSTSFSTTEAPAEIQLASSLALCSMESILGEGGQWYDHLLGASHIIDEAFAVTGAMSRLESTYEGRWLLRNFAYHDVIASVAMSRAPLMRGKYWASGGDHLIDSYFGLASDIIHLMSEVSWLAADMKSYYSDHENKEQSGRSRSDQVANPSYSPDKRTTDYGQTREFSVRAFSLEQDLQQWFCPPLQDPSVEALAEAYRSAALLHLYRVIRNNLPDLAALVNPKIDHRVARIVESIQAIPASCHAECTLLFPLFMAGGEVKDVQHKFIIRERMRGIVHYRRFHNVRAAMAVLDELWRLKARKDVAPGANDVDWLDILATRKLRLSLT